MKTTNDNAILIIGGGIAGLAAGVYLQSSGYEVTIIESHVLPGGLSTSWKRKGYLFEGGMHWLTGSDPRLALNRVWREVGALQANNPVTNRDPIYTLVDGEKRLCLWRGLDRMQEAFDAFSPEDAKVTRQLVRDIKTFLPVHLVITDIPFLKSTKPAIPNLMELIAMTGAGLKYNKLKNMSYIDYVARFKSSDIRHLLMSVIGYRYNALSFVYTLASFASGDCGYPTGGSRVMAQNMADKFASLGGKILYNTRVERVIIEDNRVTGVKIAGGAVMASSKVLVTQDTRAALDEEHGLFSPPLHEPWTKRLMAVTAEQNMFISLGIKAELSALPTCMVLPLDEPFEAAGNKFTELRISCYTAGYAPEGCSVLTCILLCDCYDWWRAARDNGTYKEEKEKLLQRYIAVLEEKLPEVRGNIDVTDVATPLTYQRYTSSYKGSWMSVWLPGGKPFGFPAASKSAKGLYFASQRTTMPGGLPLTVNAARKAAQRICRDSKRVFRVPEV